MVSEPSAWHAADKAYQAHHAACPQCCAAGLNPGGPARCAVGADLWAAYEGAGHPPHFMWLRSKGRTS